MKYWLIALSIFGLTTIAQADYRTIEIKISVPATLTDEQAKKLEMLKALIKELSVDIVEPLSSYGVPDEKKVKTHICKHDTGQPCVAEEELEAVEFSKEEAAVKEADVTAVKDILYQSKTATPVPSPTKAQ